MVSGWLGVDWHRPDLLLGLALSRSHGGVRYDDTAAVGDDGDGTVTLDLTSVYPYARWSPDEGLDVWGFAGLGSGRAKLEDRAGGNETDIGMRMAAAGMRRALASWGERELDLAVKMDGFVVGLDSDARGLETADSGDDLPAVNASAQRVRLALEGTHAHALASGAQVRSTLELGARHDRGGVETGVGVDLAGGVRYEDPSRGLTVEASGRLSLAHEAEGFREWGAGGAIRLAPDANGRGFSLSAGPSWGSASGGAERLWNEGVEARSDTGTPRGRVDAELGYGLGVFGGRGLLTPHVAASLTEGDGRDLRAGTRLQLGPSLELDAGVGYRESGGGEARIGIDLRLSITF